MAEDGTQNYQLKIIPGKKIPLMMVGPYESKATQAYMIDQLQEGELKGGHDVMTHPFRWSSSSYWRSNIPPDFAIRTKLL